MPLKLMVQQEKLAILIKLMIVIIQQKGIADQMLKKNLNLTLDESLVSEVLTSWGGGLEVLSGT